MCLSSPSLFSIYTLLEFREGEKEADLMYPLCRGRHTIRNEIERDRVTQHNKQDAAALMPSILYIYIYKFYADNFLTFTSASSPGRGRYINHARLERGRQERGEDVGLDSIRLSHPLAFVEQCERGRM